MPKTAKPSARFRCGFCQFVCLCKYFVNYAIFMQSHCIYAEAFAGPFRPLRAPEPPFTHKTPPFTQVLFLFDAFYGTISLRKPSSLCSYKTESEAPMKKRILALLLAFSMMLSLLPVSALADTGGVSISPLMRVMGLLATSRITLPLSSRRPASPTPKGASRSIKMTIPRSQSSATKAMAGLTCLTVPQTKKAF